MNLRDYQQEAKRAVFRELIDHGRRSTLVVKPTGTGKTVLFASIADDWRRDLVGAKGKVLVVAHRGILLDQAAKTLPDYHVANFEMGGSRCSTFEIAFSDVIFASKDSLHERRLGKFDPWLFGLVIVDEAHRCARKNRTYQRFLDHFGQNKDCKFLGVTATPDRTDRAALVGEGRPFETVAYQYPLWDAEGGPSALSDGWLVTPRQRFVVCEGLSLADCKLSGGDFTDTDLEAQFATEEMLHRVCLPVSEMVGGRPTLVFGATVAHVAGHEKDGKHVLGLADILERYRPGRVRVVHGKQSEEERGRSLAEFRAGQVQFLVSCDLLIEGFDETTVAAVVICRPTKSRARYSQMVGRGLRPHFSVVSLLNAAPGAPERLHVHRNGPKPDCLVIDTVGVGDLCLSKNLADILEEQEDHPAVALAKKKAAGKTAPSDMAKLIEEARAELWQQGALASLDRRAKLVARGKYHFQETDPLGGAGVSAGRTKAVAPKRPATEKQVNFLCKLGVPRSTAEGYSAGQAGAVIDKLLREKGWKKAV